jgi:AcrR family transcriptional regulator
MTMSQRARRAEVLDTAAAVFASSGYVGTSLKDIADACGIQAGSLYHHFDSKEAIVVELVARFQAEMASIGDAALKSADNAPASAPGHAPAPVKPAVAEQVVALCTSIAECAFAHRAALQLTSYEPPAGASAELVRLVSSRPASVPAAMTAILQRAAAEGAIAPDVDVTLLAEELCEAMRHPGLGVLYRDANAREVATVLCHLLFDGGPAEPPSDDRLDRSAARLAANAAIRAWADRGRDGDERADRTAMLLSVARAEFARRGYEATTIRDIAAAAGIGTGNVYRFIESKDAMLESIMGSFHTRLSDGYRAVIASDSTTVAKLDALTWLNINILESFPEEFAIQRAWMRAIPPAASNLTALQLERARQIQDIVAEGVRRGELRDGRTGAVRPSIDVLAMCYRDLVWPSSLVKLAGPARALAHSRATLMRGAATAELHGHGGVTRPRPSYLARLFRPRRGWFRVPCSSGNGWRHPHRPPSAASAVHSQYSRRSPPSRNTRTCLTGAPHRAQTGGCPSWSARSWCSSRSTSMGLSNRAITSSLPPGT